MIDLARALCQQCRLACHLYDLQRLARGSSQKNVSKEQMEKAARAGTYKSHHLKLLSASDNVKGVFQMGGFERYIASFTDREKAIASF